MTTGRLANNRLLLSLYIHYDQFKTLKRLLLRRFWGSTSKDTWVSESSGLGLGLAATSGCLSLVLSLVFVLVFESGVGFFCWLLSRNTSGSPAQTTLWAICSDVVNVVLHSLHLHSTSPDWSMVERGNGVVLVVVIEACVFLVLRLLIWGLIRCLIWGLLIACYLWRICRYMSAYISAVTGP